MQSIDEIINYRRSVRVYDENADYDPEVAKRCVKRATLAPNSSNMQLFTIEKGSKSKLTVYKIKQQKETETQSNQAKFLKFRASHRDKNEEYIRYMYSAL